jgi:hypothetical protein
MAVETGMNTAAVNSESVVEGDQVSWIKEGCLMDRLPGRIVCYRESRAYLELMIQRIASVAWVESIGKTLGLLPGGGLRHLEQHSRLLFDWPNRLLQMGLDTLAAPDLEAAIADLKVWYLPRQRGTVHN